MISIRASALNSVFDCPRRVMADMLEPDLREKFAIRQKANQPTHIASAVGTALHKFAETGSRKWVAHLKSDRFIRYDSVTPEPAVAYRQLDAMADAMDAKLPYWRDARLIEEELRLVIPAAGKDEPDITLTGHPDRIDNDGCLWDIKTGRASVGEFAPQMGAYAMLAKGAGFEITECRIAAISRRSADILLHYYAIEDCERAVRTAIRHIKAYWQRTAKGKTPEAIPCNPKSVLCKAQYCVAHGTNFCPITKTQWIKL